MAGKTEDIDTSTDKRNERDNEQALNDLADVDPGGQPAREVGSWIGQNADKNTEDVRERLPEGAERVAVTNNESDDATSEPESRQGHREADPQHGTGLPE